MKLFLYWIKLLICAFMIGVGMTIFVSVVGVVTGVEALLEPTTSRVTMIVSVILAIPLCLKYLKKENGIKGSENLK